jgi:hypothetical protein
MDLCLTDFTEIVRVGQRVTILLDVQLEGETAGSSAASCGHHHAAHADNSLRQCVVIVSLCTEERGRPSPVLHAMAAPARGKPKKSPDRRDSLLPLKTFASIVAEYFTK